MWRGGNAAAQAAAAAVLLLLYVVIVTLLYCGTGVHLLQRGVGVAEAVHAQSVTLLHATAAARSMR